ncbi:MAG: redoxin family protein [Proteobacteria bacterium]|nr:redoxin family protein [Pseudomonadota bacterium]
MKRFFFLVLVSLFIFSCAKKEEEKKAETTPQKTVESKSTKELKSISAKDLQEILKSNQGKVVLVNFFATWCPPCRKEVPELVELYKTYQSKNVEFIGIAIDENGASAVTPFAEKVNINYSLYLTTQDLNNIYKIDAVPTTLLYDKKGRLIQTITGYVEGGELARMIDMML